MSDWTLDTLKEHLEALIDAERNLRLARYQENQLAIDKAAIAVEKRLTSMNEFRNQLREQAATFVTRDSQVEQDRAFAVYRDLVSQRFERLETWQAKILGAMGVAMLIVPIATAVIVSALTHH